MSLSNAITIVGDKALIAKMTGLAPKVQKQVIKPAAKIAAQPIRDRAQALAPKLTGAMSDGIVIRLKSGRNPGAMVETPRRAKLGIAPDDPSYYPAHVEYGHKGAPAHPFMRPAWEMTKDAALKIFERELWAGIQREAMRK